MQINKTNDYYQMSNYLFKEFPDCVGVNQLQEMLGIKRTKAYELLKNGTIKSVKMGKDYKVSKLNVIAYLYGGDQVWQVN